MHSASMSAPATHGEQQMNILIRCISPMFPVLSPVPLWVIAGRRWTFLPPFLPQIFNRALKPVQPNHMNAVSARHVTWRALCLFARKDVVAL